MCMRWYRRSVMDVTGLLTWIWEMSYRQELYLSSLATIILCNKNHKTSVTYNKQKTFLLAHAFMGWLDRSATWARQAEGKGGGLRRLLICQALCSTWDPSWDNKTDSPFPLSHPVADWCRYVLMERQRNKSMSINVQKALKTLFASCLVSLTQENHTVKLVTRVGEDYKSDRAKSMETGRLLTGSNNTISILQELNMISKFCGRNNQTVTLVKS